MAGEEGFEPSYAGIKIRCLNQLGDSPVVFNSICPVMKRVTLESLRHESAHPPRHLGLNRERFGFVRKLGEDTRSGARHARLRAPLPEPREMRCHLGIARAHYSFKIVCALPREKGRYCESFRIACQRDVREDFLRQTATCGGKTRYQAGGSSSAFSRSPMPSPNAFFP